MRIPEDPIVAEVRRIRAENAAKHDNDIRRIVAAAQRRQRASNRKAANLAPAK